MSLTVRAAVPDDAAHIVRFITELAIYERAEHEMKADESMIRDTLFGDRPHPHALIAMKDDQPIGLAVYFFNYSTWLGHRGLYVEDVFVTSSARGQGAGLALMQALARIAVDNNCPRFDWQVLDWNQPAIDFYDAIGALPRKEWLSYRLEGEALKRFADSGARQHD
ncbi:GNAT family N-acetyltransferase [Kushneria konosiri]|uniref:GNAT family N-acetyltransferase n=1 Tax=Kushneria konosiri TaxID=698828 RepID=A0A2Z2H8H2_9GAMM|nr:GNAT family N-acetyltransferase [Kushneria konosiri]ARS53226.1 GNAT family N-acetyltransferase [Kushneria konosiri]